MQGKHCRTAEEFMSYRMTKIEDALIVEQANSCMEKCKQPVDILKRVLGSSLKEVTRNIQECMKETQKVNEETN